MTPCQIHQSTSRAAAGEREVRRSASCCPGPALAWGCRPDGSSDCNPSCSARYRKANSSVSPTPNLCAAQKRTPGKSNRRGFAYFAEISPFATLRPGRDPIRKRTLIRIKAVPAAPVSFVIRRSQRRGTREVVHLGRRWVGSHESAPPRRSLGSGQERTAIPARQRTRRC